MGLIEYVYRSHCELSEKKIEEIKKRFNLRDIGKVLRTKEDIIEYRILSERELSKIGGFFLKKYFDFFIIKGEHPLLESQIKSIPIGFKNYFNIGEIVERLGVWR